MIKIIKICFALIYMFIMVSISYADTFEAKYNTAQWLPVVVFDGTDGITPITGVVYTGVTVWYKEGLSGTWTQLTLAATSCTATSGYFCEESSTNAPGSYRVYVPATVVDTLTDGAKLFYIVKGTGYKTYWGELSVKTYLASEESDKFPSSGTIPNTSTTMPGNVTQWSGTNVAAVDAAGYPKVTVRWGTTCQITAATSGSSFTIGSCTDHAGNAITLATDTFVGTYLVAYNRGATQCNVVGEGVFVSDLTTGVVTVKTTDMPGSDFSATPSTANCNVGVSP